MLSQARNNPYASIEALKRSETHNKRLLKTLSHEFAVLANGLSMFGQKSVREKYKVNFKPGSL